MARYFVATHTARQTHDWLCSHCHASGHVTVSSRGKAEARVWISEQKAGEGAHEGAAIALEQDAIRICSLVRCPSCRRRAPNAAIATAWHGLMDLGRALGAAFVVVLIGAAADLSMMPALGLGLLAALVTLFFGDERRRWREAGRVKVQLTSRPPRRPTAPPAPTARPMQSSDGPFRSLPAPPPIVTERAPAPAMATPIVESGDSSDQPSFLR